jgi:hypothetical protein
MADFPLNELDLAPETLAALEGAGYSTFLAIIDLERDDLLAIPGVTEEAADRILSIIDELTVVEGEAVVGDETDEEEAEGAVPDAGES